MTLRLLAEAEHETEIAALWYDQKQTGLGLAFLDELEKVYARIESNPRLFLQVFISSEVAREVRRAIVDRFPYKVVFEVVDPETIVVLAVAHQRRRPSHGTDRLANE